MVASDQHQPASSIATLATSGFLRGFIVVAAVADNFDQVKGLFGM